MDAASRALHRAKEDILLSKEWVEIKQEIQRQQNILQQSHTAKGSFFDAIQIQSTAAYKRLQAKVSYSLAENFMSSSKYSQHPLASSVGTQFETAASRQTLLDESSLHIRKACAYLLEDTPHLKHHLKKHFNHPLPREFRPTAWKVLLQNKRLVAKAGTERYLHRHKDETGIGQKCEAVLKSSRAFTPVAHSTVLQKAMQEAVAHWNFQKRSEAVHVSVRDLLLCIPFLYVWKEKLQASSSARVDSKATFQCTQDVVAEVTDVYCCFMENLPHTMDSYKSSKATDAMNQLSLQVEILLSSGVPQLHRHLTVLFSKSAILGKELPFHVHLRGIIQLCVQRMFVGDLSLDVVCYIWDQCFIGRLVPGFQCLAYYITVWFILLKDHLEGCHRVKAVTDVLATMSTKLTVFQFQNELEKRYLDKLCADLGVTPRILLVHSSMHLGPLQSRSKSSPMKRLSTHTHRQEIQPSHTSVQALSIHEAKDTEKEQLRKRVAVLNKRLEEDCKQLSDTLKQEKEQHRKDVETLIAEISALKKKVADSQRLQQISRSYESSRKMEVPVTPSNITETFSLSTAAVETALSPFSSTGGTGTSDIHRLFTKAIPSSRNSSFRPSFHSQSLPQSNNMSTTVNRSKHSTPYKEESHCQPCSPIHFSEKDAVDVWLEILSRFRDGVYLVCHGPEKEKKLLLKNLQQEKVVLVTNS